MIDKAKGIIAKPMPRYWHDRHAANKIEDPDERVLCRAIVAEKKPYFMRYIYPALMKQYNTYIKNTNRNSLREFEMTVDELRAIPPDELTERQSEFLEYYDYRMPVGCGDCVMNKICRRFEEEFDGYVGRHNSSVIFDYSIMKSDAEYSSRQFQAIKQLYENYNKRIQGYAIFANSERVDEAASGAAYAYMNEEFLKKCSMVCPNKYSLCNLILDMCYSKNSSKRFAWSMCGEEIIHNLLTKNKCRIFYPVKIEDDEEWEFEYCGEKFKTETIKLEVNE